MSLITHMIDAIVFIGMPFITVYATIMLCKKYYSTTVTTTKCVDDIVKKIITGDHFPIMQMSPDDEPLLRKHIDNYYKEVIESNTGLSWLDFLD